MVHPYQGNYSYNKITLLGWNSSSIGVYYCGTISSTNPNTLQVLYIGRAVGKDGIRNRLLQHLDAQDIPNATHFGFSICDTENEAIQFEQSEIQRLRPSLNIQFKP